MSVDSALDEVLDQWEDARTRGVTLTPEQLCIDKPELLAMLREKIGALQSMDQRMQSDEDITKVHGSARSGPRGANDQAAIPLERPQLQNGFDGLRFHAQGGLGMVFEGSDLRLHRRVALKFMHKHMADMAWARERFLLEAEITGRLDHPGIVPVHGVGFTETGRPFYAMRFIRGDTLEDAIGLFHRNESRTGGDFDREREFRNMITRLISICNTLAYAHNCGIVHRDIKPENIMLGRYAETLVVDWGLAFSVDRDETAKRSGEATLMPNSGSQAGTSTGGPAGTPAYMSPEQSFDCDNVDRRADIYSLGTMLYKILCGKLPYKGTPMQILDQLQKGRYAKPSEVVKDVPPQLEAICRKAMSFDPDDRYQTALDMAGDLERWLADEPIAVYTESRSIRWGRWLRRHRGLALGVLIGLFALSLTGLIAAVGLGTYAQTESGLRASAELARQEAEDARRQSLRAAALLASETIGREIDRRWALLERYEMDPELVDLLMKIDADPKDAVAGRGLQDWLSRLKSRWGKMAPTHESLFLVSGNGTQVAREPIEEGRTIGKNYARRDYFHGQGRDLKEADPLPEKPIESPHLSTVYQSTSGDKALKVACTVPIWSDKPGTPDRRVLGVLGMSVELNNFGGVLARKLPGKQTSILVDMRYDELDGSPQRGLILQHPQPQGSQAKDHYRLSQAEGNKFLEDGVAVLWENQQRSRGNLKAYPPRAASKNPQSPVNNLIPDYQDPIAGKDDENWVAAYSTVWIPRRAYDGEGGGEDASLDTGWIVVVQEKLSTPKN